MKRNLLIACGMALLLSSCAVAQETVTANILGRVFAVRHGAASATAFAVEVTNQQYLVTAKHVVPGTNSTATIKVFHESKWKDLPVKVMRSPDSDVAVLCPPVQLAPLVPPWPRCGH